MSLKLAIQKSGRLHDDSIRLLNDCGIAVKNGRKKITVIHKANVLKVLTGIFLEAAKEVALEYSGQVEVDDRIFEPG